MNVWASIYRHHRWSNLVMIDFLSALTDEQQELLRRLGPTNREHSSGGQLWLRSCSFTTHTG